jgi:hypothetical protein
MNSLFVRKEKPSILWIDINLAIWGAGRYLKIGFSSFEREDWYEISISQPRGSGGIRSFLYGSNACARAEDPKVLSKPWVMTPQVEVLTNDMVYQQPVCEERETKHMVYRY